MEFGVQQLLVGLGVLAILAIVFDAIRRHRRQKNPGIHMDLDLTGSVSGDPFNPELPGGGARQADVAGSVGQSTSLQNGAQLSSEHGQACPPSFGSAADVSNGLSVVSTGSSHTDKAQGPLSAKPTPLTPTLTAAPRAVNARAVSGSVGVARPATVKTKPADASADRASKAAEPADVLGITIHAAADQSFLGSLLMQRFIESGLRFGQHDVFHLFDVDDHLQETPLISVTNAVEPHTFDLSAMSDFSTSAITLYMPLPVLGDPEAAFGRFLTLADQLAKGLGGQLCDLYKKPLTQTTLAGMHQRLMQLCKTPAPSLEQASPSPSQTQNADNAKVSNQTSVELTD